MSGRVVFMNGQFVEESEARISIYDSALMFGDMVFEMTRSFNGVQFKLRRHLERLYASMKYLRIDPRMRIDEMAQWVNRTIEANQPAFADDDEHRIMIDVSRGLLSIYQGVQGLHHGPTIIIADFPLRWTVAGMSTLFDTGINAVIPSQRAIPAWLLEPKVKNRSRVHYLKANIEVAQVAGGNNWALLLDPDGFIAEGTGDNFFIVKNGALMTPEPRNILRGISRETIFELARDLGIRCEERNIEPYDVLDADEAFMTGTPFCMLPVTSLGGERIGAGRPGPLFSALLDAWSEKVGVDIANQIKRWDVQGGPAQVAGPTPYAFAGAGTSSRPPS